MTIIERKRFKSLPRGGEKQSWSEWQIVDGRRVVWRGCTEDVCRRFAVTQKFKITN